jgi:S-adenosylmethionine hydrolase
MPQPIITLTTDFGRADGYVGAMKGVMLGICPEATLVDISNEIRPQAVRQAAYVLESAAPYFPPGTVHLVVVDPGVGSARRPIAVQTERAIYVAPDNGVLSTVLTREPDCLAVHLTQEQYRLPVVSNTFHGRDLFAPAAAHLACGVDLREMGKVLAVTDLVRMDRSQPEPIGEEAWQGEILHIDRFGNLITNVELPLLQSETPERDRGWVFVIGSERIEGLSRTFADVEPGQLVAYIGSSGYLEIGVRGADAVRRLGVDIGSPVWVHASPSSTVSGQKPGGKGTGPGCG